MTYTDRKGDPMDREVWRGKIADPHYALVERTHVDCLLIETTWLGLASDWEKPPGALFLTEVKEMGKSGWRTIEERWKSDELDAYVTHRNLVAYHRDRLGVG